MTQTAIAATTMALVDVFFFVAIGTLHCEYAVGFAGICGESALTANCAPHAPQKDTTPVTLVPHLLQNIIKILPHYVSLCL
jgi:hypothetical protein